MFQDASISTYDSGDTEARQQTMSDWFFRFADNILDRVDSNTRNTQPLSNAGVNFGIGADGSVYVLGQTTANGQTRPVGSLTISPVMLLAGAVALYLLLKRK